MPELRRQNPGECVSQEQCSRIFWPGSALQALLIISYLRAARGAIRAYPDSLQVEIRRHVLLCQLVFYPNGAALFQKDLKICDLYKGLQHDVLTVHTVMQT
jgi:hypothetical protein